LTIIPIRVNAGIGLADEALKSTIEKTLCGAGLERSTGEPLN